MRRLTQQDIISRIKEVHGDTYDLSKVKYVNRRTKILVGCKNHDSIHYWETTTEQLFRGTKKRDCISAIPLFISDPNLREFELFGGFFQ